MKHTHDGWLLFPTITIEGGDPMIDAQQEFGLIIGWVTILLPPHTPIYSCLRGIHLQQSSLKLAFLKEVRFGPPTF